MMHFRQFFGADCGTDDSVLFRLDNGTVDAVYEIVRTVLCRYQCVERCPFSLDGVLQVAVYVV